MNDTITELVHCEVNIYPVGHVIEESDALKMQIFAIESGDKWEYAPTVAWTDNHGNGVFDAETRLMVITLTPLPSCNPITPYRSYLEMEIAEAGDVDEFFLDYCEDIVQIAARKMETEFDHRSTWFTFTLICEGAYAVYRDDEGYKHATFELDTVLELDYAKLRMAAAEATKTE
jgi:hypothetical protein